MYFFMNYKLNISKELKRTLLVNIISNIIQNFMEFALIIIFEVKTLSVTPILNKHLFINENDKKFKLYDHFIIEIYHYVKKKHPRYKDISKQYNTPIVYDMKKKYKKEILK